MTPGLRKLALTAHVTCSVGWLGAVVAYLAVAIACLVSRDAEMVHSGFSAMELMGWCVIVPLSLAALLTGLVQSLGTDWGLFRYYWVLVKFALTVGAVIILLKHMPAVSRGHGAQAEVIHAGGGVLVLLMTTTLSVYKPWGRTRYGRRKQQERRGALGGTPLSASPGLADPHNELPAGGLATGLKIFLVVVGVLVAVFVLLHLSGGHLGSHGH
jgi:hypothetical protein